MAETAEEPNIRRDSIRSSRGFRIGHQDPSSKYIDVEEVVQEVHMVGRSERSFNAVHGAGECVVRRVVRRFPDLYVPYVSFPSISGVTQTDKERLADHLKLRQDIIHAARLSSIIHEDDQSRPRIDHLSQCRPICLRQWQQLSFRRPEADNKDQLVVHYNHKTSSGCMGRRC